MNELHGERIGETGGAEFVPRDSRRVTTGEMKALEVHFKFVGRCGGKELGAKPLALGLGSGLVEELFRAQKFSFGIGELVVVFPAEFQDRTAAAISRTRLPAPAVTRCVKNRRRERNSGNIRPPEQSGQGKNARPRGTRRSRHRGRCR